MPKGTTASNDYLKLLYNATAIGNIADNAAASPLTNLYASLMSAWPGVGGDQSTNEISYTGYARVAVARSGSGWTVTGNSVSPVAQINFGQCTGGTATAFYFGVGTAVSGTGKMLHFGPIGTKLGPFTAIAAGDVITIPGLSGLAVDDRIAFFTGDPAGLPSGLTEGTVYWVKTVSANDITVSTTQGGAAVDITAAGDGLAWKITPIAISSGVTPGLGTGTTIVDA
jgi:hypothetical protein